jgi:endonuclease G
MQGITATGEDAVWFTSLPVELVEGDTFSVKVVTDKATYSKEVTVSAGKSLAFTSGNILKFSVSALTRKVNGTTEFTLVTDAANLSVGDQIIITNGPSGTVNALSTTQNTDYRGVASVTVSDNKIMTVTNDVQILELVEGTKSNTFGLYTGSGYLFAASSTSSSKLQTNPTLDDSGSWAISITSNKAKIQAQTSTDITRNLLQYNSSYPRFCAYASNSGMTDGYIFSKSPSNPRTPLATPTNLEATAQSNVVTVRWNTVEGAVSYTVTCGEQSKTVSQTSVQFTMGYTTQYDVSVVANPADINTYTTSEAAKTTVTTGECLSTTVIFDLTKSNLPSLVSGTNDITGIYQWVYDNTASPNISLVYGKGTGTSAPYFYNAASSNTQINSGNTLTIEGKSITKITFTTTTPTVNYLSADNGAYDMYVWSGYSNKITFTAAGGYCRITRIEVQYDNTATAVFTPYIIDVNPTSIDFDITGGSNTITATVMNPDYGTLSASGLSSPFTTAVNGNRITVTAPANSRTPISRTLTISISKGNSVQVPIKQEGTESGIPALDKSWLELPAASAGGGNMLTRSIFPSGSSERNYTMFYDKSTYTAYWVAYPLASSHIGGSRSGTWVQTPGIDVNDQINVWSGTYGVDYQPGNIYARGHQIPDADRSGNSAMQQQTYYATNSTPQIQNSFNGGIWNSLEGDIRKTIPVSDTLYVVTGAIFRTVGGSEDIKYIQPTNDSKLCPVPNYYYKVVLKCKRNASGAVTSASTIGFWFEHKPYSGSYTSYTKSVAEIEQLTGFNFFANLPADISDTAEQNASWTSFTTF